MEMLSCLALTSCQAHPLTSAAVRPRKGENQRHFMVVKVLTALALLWPEFEQVLVQARRRVSMHCLSKGAFSFTLRHWDLSLHLAYPLRLPTHGGYRFPFVFLFLARKVLKIELLASYWFDLSNKLVYCLTSE